MAIYLCGDFDFDEAAQWAQALRRALPDEQWLTTLDDADRATVDVAVVANPPPGSLQGLPRLRLIQSLWAGVDRLLGDASLPADVPLARMVDPAMSTAMAESVQWAVTALQRDFFTYARQQRAGVWRPHPQRRADEWPVLVLGAGEMGGAVARRLAANGHPVLAWRRGGSSHGSAAMPAPAPAPAPVHGQAIAVQAISGDAALATAWAQARVVVNLLPLTAETRGFFNAARLAQMAPGTHLVNFARGAHLVDGDALAALAEGRLGELVLDVFATEPLPASHPFWSHPRVTVLPHVAAQTDVRSAAAVVAANVQRLRRGEPLLHRVERARGY